MTSWSRQPRRKGIQSDSVNRRQRIALITGGLICVLMSLFPPTYQIIPVRDRFDRVVERKERMGYSFFMTYGAGPDLARYGVQVIAVIISTGVAFLLLGTKPHLKRKDGSD